MNSIRRLILVSCILFALPLSAEEPKEGQPVLPFKVMFKIDTVDDRKSPAQGMRCKHRDILRMRPDGKPGGSSVATLALTKETALAPDTFDYCQKVFSTLTGLDKVEVRDELAAILLEMPCDPGAEVYIMLSSARNDRALKEYPQLKDNRIVNSLEIEGCIKEMPILCSFPSSITRWDTQSVILDQKKMLHAFRSCRDDLIKAAEATAKAKKAGAIETPEAKSPTTRP